MRESVERLRGDPAWSLRTSMRREEVCIRYLRSFAGRGMQGQRGGRQHDRRYTSLLPMRLSFGLPFLRNFCLSAFSVLGGVRVDTKARCTRTKNLVPVTKILGGDAIPHEQIVSGLSVCEPGSKFLSHFTNPNPCIWSDPQYGRRDV